MRRLLNSRTSRYPRRRSNNVDVETVKKFIPLGEYTADMKVQKAVELVKENAVVDNTAAEEASAE